MKTAEYIIIVNNASEGILTGVDDAYKMLPSPKLRGLLLTDHAERYKPKKRAMPIDVVPCSFKTDAEIEAALAPYKERIRAVVCAGEKHIQYLRKVIPHLPPSVLVPSPRALEIATNKRLMRETFLQHAPEITPKFVQVHDDSDATVERVEAALQFPVIVKPANLASSLLVQSCYNRAELEKALRKIFDRISPIYEREGRQSAPEVLVEEYLEGDFYSIDAHVREPGDVYFCPPVGYVPAKQLGIDDFFLYKRFVPTKLTEAEVAAANETVARALAAIGLTYSSAHVELVLTSRGWKVIELGPRLGRFRHLMYQTSYGINHYLNDVLVHLGEKPRIGNTLLQHCAGYIIYPETEGTLQEIAGLDELKKDPALLLLHVFMQPGNISLHAKHGGRAAAEFVIAGKDAAAFNKTMTFVEDTIKAIVA